MESAKYISSPNNPLVKKLVQIKDKSRERKKSGLFMIEGIRELSLALKGGYQLETILFCDAILTDTSILINYPAKEVIGVSKEVYQKIAHRDTTEGIVALAHTKSHTLNNLELTDNPLILVAEAPEKPGNIGALLRTADAANIDAVLIANPKTDIYNPNTIRSSVGCSFTTQIGMGSTKEILNFLKEKHIAIYCAALSASKNYVEIDYSKAAAIVVGTEATGLSDNWLAASTQNIIIPMQGEIDSMNVSVSAAILIFEAKRQRGFN
ncbi:RNA methyltransferase [Flavobacterium sp. ASW18X]|uniref:TrmH family RNA methyltransferase n=1 Tax=Flavobacterium sp. ASW18X TaxID=2572595 RepID=UPI0010AEC7BE|nr:RNA methyltransferase [Flavobacterium sp. ASW18X]TKD62455.1 RNA methyltransferase [Flavobacterium sp. ASW18X]